MGKRNICNQAKRFQQIAGDFWSAAWFPQPSSESHRAGRLPAGIALTISAVIWRRRQTGATVGNWFQIKNDAR
jgi:hypothetical protein